MSTVARGQIVTQAIAVVSTGQTALDRSTLFGIGAAQHWIVSNEDSFRRALRAVLETRAPVFICEAQTPDGDWKRMLRLLGSVSHHPELIVTSRTADERLWSEVLNLGGFDVLMTPLDDSEAVRVIAAAYRHWVNERSDGAPRRGCWAAVAGAR